MVREAVRRRGGIHYVVGDMTKLPFKPGSFDRCVSLGALHCVDPVEFFQQAGQVLRPQGEVLVLAEVWIIPLFAPWANKEAIREGIRGSGMKLKGEIKIKHFYRLFRALKP